METRPKLVWASEVLLNIQKMMFIHVSTSHQAAHAILSYYPGNMGSVFSKYLLKHLPIKTMVSVTSRTICTADCGPDPQGNPE